MSTPRKKPESGEKKGRLFTPLATKTGLSEEAVPHSIRHTAATQMLAAGVGIKVVSERLGHEDVATTLRHSAHVLVGRRGQAVKAVEAVFLAEENPMVQLGQKPKRVSRPQLFTTFDLDDHDSNRDKA